MAKMSRIVSGSVGAGITCRLTGHPDTKGICPQLPPLTRMLKRDWKMGQHRRPERDSSESQKHCLTSRLFSHKKQQRAVIHLLKGRNLLGPSILHHIQSKDLLLLREGQEILTQNSPQTVKSSATTLGRGRNSERARCVRTRCAGSALIQGTSDSHVLQRKERRGESNTLWRGTQASLGPEEGAGTLRRAGQHSRPPTKNKAVRELTLLLKQLVEEQLKIIKDVEDVNITINH